METLLNMNESRFPRKKPVSKGYNRDKYYSTMITELLE